MKTQLLCTFTDKDSIDKTVNEIIDSHEVMFDKIYIFTNKNDSDEVICTYNVDSVNIGSLLKNTISLHRKKQTNTLYTINAINEVIKELNGGRIDRKFPIPWNQYHNTLLVTNSDGLVTINTKLHSIIEVNELMAKKEKVYLEGNIKSPIKMRGEL